MAGAIAGTALINYASQLSDKLSTVTLTINNLCNLSCPHCYLQYEDGGTKFITGDILEQLYRADFKHLVVVGKEPFVNKRSVSLLEEITNAVKKQGKTVGVITNGIGLDKMNTILAKNLSYIDVSFDGGPISYNNYRKGNFEQLISNINGVAEQYSFTAFNALHVVSDQTIANISDMVDVGNFFEFKNIMFSPYIETLNNGANHVSKLKIREILSRFSANNNFMNSQASFILLDIYHLLGDISGKAKYADYELHENMEFLKEMVRSCGVEAKVKLIEKDPIFHGFVRLTYDGYLLSPYASLNPADYKKEGVLIDQMSIAEFFNLKLQSFQKVA
jgi:MoaA/NifB/PqqE/SkfB family radical SAM enzyme